MYRKERKKHSRKTSERATAHSSEDGSCGSPVIEDDEPQQPSSSSDDESSIEDETISIELTQELRDCLEQDYYLIHTENKVLSYS